VCQRGDCEATGPAHAAMDTVARGRTAFIWSQRLQRQRHVATAAAKHRRMHAQHHSMNAQNCDLDRGGGAQCSRNGFVAEALTRATPRVIEQAEAARGMGLGRVITVCVCVCVCECASVCERV